MGKLFPRILVATCSLGASLVAAELGLRAYFGGGIEDEHDLRERLEESRRADLDEGISMFGLVQPSPWEDVVYELKPGLDGEFRGKQMRTNSVGLRGPEHSLEKPPGTVRIVGVGDSHMFGWGVGQDELYLRRMERLLNEDAPPGVRYEAINFGVPGYNTTMEVATLQHRGLAYDPDVVVIQFVANDFMLPYFLQLGSGDAGGPNLYLVSLLRALVRPPEAFDDGAELHRYDVGEHDAEVEAETDSKYAYMLGPEGYRRAMARLAGLSREHGFSVVLLLGTRGTRPDTRPLVLEVAREHGFTVVDALPALRERLRAQGRTPDVEAMRDAYEIPGDVHPSARAHEVYGELLARTLRGLL